MRLGGMVAGIEMLHPCVYPTPQYSGSSRLCSERRGQSQKPEEIYELIERLVPGGRLPREILVPVCFCS